MASSIIHYPYKALTDYIHYLANLGEISRLNTDGDIPLLYYRWVEKIYSDSFGCLNLTRKDIPIDMKCGNYGVGIKTFLEGNRETFQKIQEFDKVSGNINKIRNPKDLVSLVSKIRNQSLRDCQTIYDVDKLIFHCVVRSPNSINLYEEPMDFIDIPNITIDQVLDKKSIKFSDGYNNYEYSIPKSTLLKRFKTTTYFATEKVVIRDDIYKILDAIASALEKESFYPKVILPLYSYKGKAPFVFPKSGINAGKAGGRVRDPYEVYIPVSKEFNNHCSSFFQGEKFYVTLPTSISIEMRFCQAGNKALTSTDNSELGHWLIDDVLKVAPDKAITIEDLQKRQIDSISIVKKNQTYYMDIASYGEYEKFKKQGYSIKASDN